MRRLAARIGVILSASIVILVGFVTLLGLLIGEDFATLGPLLVANEPYSVRTAAQFLIQLVTIVLSLAVFLGIFNLLYVNALRVLGTFRRSTLSAGINSIILLVSFCGAFILYFLDRDLSTQLLEEVQVPLESALASLLFFALVYGGFRLLKDRVTIPRIVFLVAMLLVLTAPLLPGTLVADVVDWMLRIPVNAGMRGILLGIALATVVVGLRVLIGQDRSYGE